MRLTGQAHRYGDNVDTDMIIPARYLKLARAEQARHAMEDADPGFVGRVKQGDLVVAGRNFGCGSSRAAHRVLVDNGISAIVAASFATIFMRNAVNEGVPIFKCPDAAAGIATGDQVEADLDTGLIRNLSSAVEYRADPLPEFIRRIIADGGLVPYARRKIREKELARGKGGADSAD